MAFRDLVLNNFKWKFAATVLAIFVWFVIQIAISRGFQPSDQTLNPQAQLENETFFRLPVMVLTTPGDTRTFQITPSTVDVTVQLRIGTLKKPIEKSIRVFVNLGDRPDIEEDLADVYAYVPQGIDLIKLEPRSVTIRVGPTN